MLALGFDPGIAMTGYGLVRLTGESLSLVDWGKITTDSDTLTTVRLAEIEADVTELIRATNPDIVGFEHPFFGSQITSAGKVLQAMGVMLLVCGKEGYPEPILLHQSQVKAAVASGNSDKYEVAWAVRQIFADKNIGKVPDDVTDAIATAYALANGVTSKI